jgi:hypothetical protein
MRRFIIGFVAGALLSFLLSSCSQQTEPDKNTTPEDTAAIIKTQDIGVAGGTISITGTRTALDGMTITIPPGSYASLRTIAVGYRKMDTTALPAGIAASSPLITISGGSGYADSLITVKIPASIPAGTFAMPFSYDKNNRRFEGLPLTWLDDTSVTFETRRLSLRGQEGARFHNGEEAYFLPLVILGVAEETLRNKAEIATGFKPGVDDWEFVNRGSYLARGGHCAGQSITALWYFDEKKAALGPLYGRFDRLDSVEFDNPAGYRFASVVHQDLNWDGVTSELFFAMRANPLFAHWSWWAFALSMYVTASPQYVGLKSASGGHAILAYKISLSDSLLYVADPNFPGKERTIRFVSDTFAPYSSRQNADDIADKPYTAVGYRGVSSLIGWEEIGSRWQEMEDGSIGSIAPNTFPSYTIRQRFAAQESPIDSVILTGRDTIDLLVRCPACDTGYGATDAQPLRIFDNNGVYIATTDLAAVPESNRGIIRLILRADTSKLGLYALGSFKTPPPDVKRSSKFLDFRWITVLKRQVRISPAPFSGDPGKAYELTASHTLPNVEYFVWNFSDGSDEIQTTESTVSHAWEGGGDYTIRLTAYNDLDWPISADTAIAFIIGPRPALSSLVPARGPAGDTITLRGASFGKSSGGGRYVLFCGDTIRNPVSWTDTLIRVVIPVTAKGYTVAVYASGQISNYLSFSITTRNPTIRSITPNKTAIDSIITIKGNNLKFRLTTTSQRITKVLFSPAGTYNNTYATVASSQFLDWTDTSIVVKVPYQAKSGNIMVSADDSLSNPIFCTITHDYSKPMTCNATLWCDTEDKQLSTGVTGWTTNSRIQWYSASTTNTDSSMLFGYDSLTTSPEGVKVTRKCAINASVDSDSPILSLQASSYAGNWFPTTDSTLLILDLKADLANIPLYEVQRQPSTTPGDTLTSYTFQARGEIIADYIKSLSRATSTFALTGYKCTTNSSVSVIIVVKK